MSEDGLLSALSSPVSAKKFLRIQRRYKNEDYDADKILRKK